MQHFGVFDRITFQKGIVMAYTDTQMQQMIAEYGPTVYRLAMAQLRHPDDADDTYQDVFLKLIRHQPQFESPTHQKSWFIRVTINCCKDRLKRASRRDLPLEEAEQRTEDPDHLALQEALSQLSEQARVLVHLYYYEGYTSEEIGALMAMNASTVRSRLKRARAKLKEFMTEGEDDIV